MRTSASEPAARNKRRKMTDTPQGAQPFRYWLVTGDSEEVIDGGIVDEVLLTIYVNAEEVATIMCSPVTEEMLVLGFLYNEGVIDRLEDVALLQMNARRNVADVFLAHSDFTPARRLTITSGCGGGVTLQNLAEYHPPLETSYATTPDMILSQIPALQRAAKLYKQVRGIHSAMLTDAAEFLLSAEDVGRHNTIDKIAGMALHNGISTRDTLLFTSGRISSEMATKARRLQIPIVVSRTAPTAMAIQLADLWNICLIGYARRNTFRVYTHPQRVGLVQPDSSVEG